MEKGDYYYWDEYYRQKRAEEQPSLFALYVMSGLSAQESLIDLGCGNGRDALFFHRNLIRVTAIDQSPAAISMMQASGPEDIQCVCGDITKVSSLCEGDFDNAYSRFSIHALTYEQQQDLIGEINSILKPGGRLWIEVRSVKDTLYGLGEQAGRNAFVYDGHYRRFIVLEELLGELESNGFGVVEAQESSGFAPYRGDDPVVIRITAKKHMP